MNLRGHLGGPSAPRNISYADLAGDLQTFLSLYTNPGLHVDEMNLRGHLAGPSAPRNVSYADLAGDLQTFLSLLFIPHF